MRWHHPLSFYQTAWFPDKSLTPNTMAKSDFDQLLHRYLSDQVTDQERIKIEAWLDVMKTHDTEDLELSKEDEDRLFQKITSKSDSVMDVISIVPKRRYRKLGHWLKIAATLLLIALASYLVFHILNKNNHTETARSNSAVEKLVLNDGTLVWLRGSSQLTYYQKNENGSDHRYAQLYGEGLFEVAKDASRPFIIRCGEVRIRVVGTSFNVKTIGDTIELSVLTGKVNVSNEVNSNTMDVAPNEKIIYKGNGMFEKIALTRHEEQLITTDTEYSMAFTNTPMGDLINSLERKFDIDIEVENKEIKNCRITVDLTDQSLEKSLQMITEVLHVQYARDGKNITLTGNGCD